jgi:type I restriction enzyme S subunit
VGVTRLQNGDIVIVDASEDYDDVAKCVEIENLENIEAVAGLHTFLMRANPEILAPRFRSFALKENSVRKACKKLSTGISVLGLSKTNLSKVRLKVSTNLKEQKAIGDFLFELNREVILEKEKLTQLKRQKKGLMQKLLTGKVRVKVDGVVEDPR